MWAVNLFLLDFRFSLLVLHPILPHFHLVSFIYHLRHKHTHTPRTHETGRMLRKCLGRILLLSMGGFC